MIRRGHHRGIVATFQGEDRDSIVCRFFRSHRCRRLGDGWVRHLELPIDLVLPYGVAYHFPHLEQDVACRFWVAHRAHQHLRLSHCGTYPESVLRVVVDDFLEAFERIDCVAFLVERHADADKRFGGQVFAEAFST